jgi:phospholipid/cholesterol/gamma-HCH transport system substrate-binding protein
MIDEKTPLFHHTRAEIAAGVFVLAGLALIGYLSISIGGLRLRPRNAYHVKARFSNVGDLKMHAPVKVAGVTIGRVESIRLVDYLGEAELGIARDMRLPKDTIVSIATAGLLGEAYVSLSPGAADVDLRDGDRIAQTEPALNMSDLVGHAAFGGSQAPASPKGAEPAPGPAVPAKPLQKGTSP